jgi:hypothetical protein
MVNTLEKFFSSLKEFPTSGLNLGRSEGNRCKSKFGNSDFVAIIHPRMWGESAMPTKSIRD